MMTNFWGSLSDSPITPALAPYFPPGANSEGGHAQDETNNIVGWYGTNYRELVTLLHEEV
jgi:hypothetical protein